MPYPYRGLAPDHRPFLPCPPPSYPPPTGTAPPPQPVYEIPPTTPRSHFLPLPLELRLQIYSHLPYFTLLLLTQTARQPRRDIHANPRLYRSAWGYFPLDPPKGAREWQKWEVWWRGIALGGVGGLSLVMVARVDAEEYRAWRRLYRNGPKGGRRENAVRDMSGEISWWYTRKWGERRRLGCCGVCLEVGDEKKFGYTKVETMEVRTYWRESCCLWREPVPVLRDMEEVRERRKAEIRSDEEEKRRKAREPRQKGIVYCFGSSSHRREDVDVDDLIARCLV